MTQQDHDAAIAAFIRAKGITRCPTVCAVATQASVAEPDRLQLRQRDEENEARRAERRVRQRTFYRFGRAA